MSRLRRFGSRLLDPFVRTRRERGLREEIDAHLDLLIRDYTDKGMSPKDARAAAARDFGCVEPMKEAYRDARGLPSLDSWVQDGKVAIRTLARDKGFTAAAVAALMLGIGATGAVYSIVNVMVLKGLPVDEPDAVVRLTLEGTNGDSMPVNQRTFERWYEAESFTGIAGYRDQTMTIRDETHPAGRVRVVSISTNAFDLLGEEPQLGRGLQALDDRIRAEPVVVVGHSVWAERYEREPSILGRTIFLDDRAATIVGVMREGFRFPSHGDVWRPLNANTRGSAGPDSTSPALNVFGRLREDATLERAQLETNTLLAEPDRDVPRQRSAVRPFVGAFRDHALFRALVGAMALVLLLACANVMNLLLVRAAARTRELSVRMAVGASRWRIVRQLLVECGLLASAGAVLGFALTFVAFRAVSMAVRGIDLPYWLVWTMDWHIVTFLAACAGASVLISGLAPALHASRSAPEGLTARGWASRTLARRRWMDGLIVAELSLALVLLAAAGFMMKSFVALVQADTAVDPERLMTFRIALPASRYSDSAARLQALRSLEERLSASSDVESVSFASTLPFVYTPQRIVAVDDAMLAEQRASIVFASPSYFRTLSVTITRGRGFESNDGTPGRSVAVVNRRFVQRYWAEQDPLGRRLRLASDDPRQAPLQLTVVGVTENVRQQNLQEIDPVVYLPLRLASGETTAVFIKASGTVDGLMQMTRAQVRALDPELPLFGTITMHELSRQSKWGHRVFGSLFAGFGVVAVILAALGVFALLSYRVRQHKHELSVRLAFGARPRDVASFVTRRIAVLVAVGTAVGLVGALGVGRLLEGLLVGTSPTDATTLTATLGLLLVSAVGACIPPLRRAIHLDPLANLRED